MSSCVQSLAGPFVVTIVALFIGWAMGMHHGAKLTNKVWSDRMAEYTDELRRRHP